MGARDQMSDAVKLRAGDDAWTPSAFASRRALEELLQGLEDLGVEAGEYVTGGCCD